MMETGDPLAGTERNEVSAKNDGIVGIEEENMIIICQEFLQTHYSNSAVVASPLCHR